MGVVQILVTGLTIKQTSFSHDLSLSFYFPLQIQATFFESHSITQAVLELLVLLPQLSEFSGGRSTPACLLRTTRERDWAL